MKIKVTFMCLLLIFGLTSYVPAKAEVSADEVILEDQYTLRASRIISGSSWSLSKKTFALYFLDAYTGYGTVTMQRQNGTSWINVGTLQIEFTNTVDFINTIDANTSSSGTYRMVYDITVGSKQETIESSTQTK